MSSTQPVVELGWLADVSSSLAVGHPSVEVGAEAAGAGGDDDRHVLVGEQVGIDEPGVLIYCPPCAAAVFGLGPDVAAEYICIWEPEPPARDDES